MPVRNPENTGITSAKITGKARECPEMPVCFGSAPPTSAGRRPTLAAVWPNSTCFASSLMPSVRGSGISALAAGLFRLALVHGHVALLPFPAAGLGLGLEAPVVVHVPALRPARPSEAVSELLVLVGLH